mmetsp:Transcript_12327/g.29338  ORF Transcript_12327/g.29338 Transcript_12327/m.29338 type:complete len:273 (+) Transcript_12327:141-959(+)
MGFFSRKSKKKTAQSNAAKAASQNDIPVSVPSTPGTKEVPTTPETTKGAESPDTAATAPNPTSIAAESETKTAGIQESKVEDDTKPEPPRAKKKHRTRISVTTPDKSDEDTSAWGTTGEHQDVSTHASTQHFDDPEMSDDKSKVDVDRSGETAANETGADSTLFIDNDEDNEDNFENSQDDEKIPREDGVNKNLLSNFEGCDILPDALKAILPESWQQAGNGTAGEKATLVKEPPKKMSYYSEEFATNFLQVSFVIKFRWLYFFILSLFFYP